MIRRFDTAAGPHLPVTPSVQRLMLEVLLAMLPGVAMQAVVFGPGVWVQLGWALAFGYGAELICLRLRGAALRPGLLDGSTAITAMLFASSVPASAPWWLSAMGMAFAIGLGKQLFGGLGRNPFNPAMLGLAVVIVSFPAEFTRWPLPFGDWDAVAQATPLDLLRQQPGSGLSMGETLAAPTFGHIGAAGQEWIALAWLLGGLVLLWRKRIPWHTPAAVIATTLLLAALPWLAEADRYAPPWVALVNGGLMLAAWFIVTDPVSGCTSPRGRLLFGAGVATLTLAIRQWGAYPDGVAFAVLLMNAAAPWLDRLGHRRDASEATP